LKLTSGGNGRRLTSADELRLMFLGVENSSNLFMHAEAQAAVILRKNPHLKVAVIDINNVDDPCGLLSKKDS